jgi:hypothetical protein
VWSAVRSFQKTPGRIRGDSSGPILALLPAIQQTDDIFVSLRALSNP